MFDWNSVSGNGKKTDSLLHDFIEGVLKKTGSGQIDLVGHSAGGGLGRGYLIDSAHAVCIAHYIHLGSRKWFTEYSWFPNKKCLNIYSAGDKVAGSMGGAVEGAVNLDLVNKDHYEVATSLETFDAILRFVNEAEDKPDTIANPVEPVQISGKAVYLGDNLPMSGAQVNIYRVDGNGRRYTREAGARFKAGGDGRWGPFTAAAKTSYEIELVPANSGERVISYFFEPFTETDRYVYLRGFPKSNMISKMLGNLPVKEEQSALVIYSSTKAMIAGRDSVTVNGITVSSPALTPASKTVISSFIFDDGDGLSSGNLLKQFAVAPFIGGVDIHLPAGQNRVHTIYYNNRWLYLPAVPSSERVLLAVFR